MKQSNIILWLAVFMSMTSTNLFAHDIAVENEDGVTIYYNYINDGKELEVTHMTYSVVGHPATYSGSVKIPETAKSNGRERKVTAIGAEAFYNCSNLTSVTIPNSVTTIGRYAFSNCSGLKSVKIYDLEAWCKISFASESANPLCYAHHLFLNDVEIKDLVIPNSVTTIGGLAFYKCSGLKSVTIPNSVTIIGSYAFSGCSGLTSVTIPNSVTTIGRSAFYYCSGLTSVTIPNSVTTIGADAFYKCSGLKSVTIPNSVTTIGADAFRGCYGLTSVTIGVNVKTIEWRAFNFTNRNGDLVEIYSHMKNPPTITTDVFSDALYNDASLYIPAGTLGKYKQTEYWNKFIWVEEIDYSTGIDSVVKQEDTDKRSYYTIDGTHIPAPQKGVNIVKTGDGKTKKVVVK